MKEINFWEEETTEDNPFLQDGKMKSGSFNKIIETLTSPLFKGKIKIK